MAELLDLFDGNKRPLGKVIVRGEEIPKGSYHIVVSVMTVAPDGRILMTLRSPEKLRGGEWEITGGSKQAGESVEAAACRELLEETGIAAAESELLFCGSARRESWFHEYYLVCHEIPAEGIRLQAGETAAAKWVTPQELLEIAAQQDPTGRERGIYLEFYGAVLRADAENREEQSK